MSCLPDTEIFCLTQIPVESSAHIKEVAFAVSVDTLLDDGYGAVERLVAGGDDDMTVVKANAFLASNSRIDDTRMVKYKKPDNAASSNSRTKYKIETYSVGEREVSNDWYVFMCLNGSTIKLGSQLIVSFSFPASHQRK